ncbi:MAG: sulfatase-like hydrolase/transferase [Cellulophaga sp.]
MKNRLRSIILSSFCLCCISLKAQKKEATNVVLITLDGFRWQELFTGADAKLIANKEFTHDSISLKAKYWRNSPEERRKALLPFIWGELLEMGQIHGNRVLGSKVSLTNKKLFSYPGYNEILSGLADDERIDSNNKFNNPNKTVLEIVNTSAKYKGKVAAFGSWDVFPFIINEERSGVPVNGGYEKATELPLSENEVLLNKLEGQIPERWSTVRFDAFTHHYTIEYMKKEHPSLVYIAYGETDDFAHEGEYDAYLKSANNTDSLLKDLWEFTQSDSFYMDNTVFIISSDHGRGTEPIETWKHHGSDIVGADQVWLMVYGKKVNPLGEVAKKEQLYSIQIAPTVLDVLNIKIDTEVMKGKPISILKK